LLTTMTPEEYGERAEAIEAQIAKVIVGQRELVRQVVVCLLCEGHVLLEGVPGLGKTQLLKTLAGAVDLAFSRIQFTPDLMPADILGTQVLEEDESGHRHFRFRPGPIFASLVLADEVNRATPKTQSAQNPIEMEGTYPLPEAQLDRFLLKVLVAFPPAADLVAVVQRTTGDHHARVEPVADDTVLSAMVDLTRQVPAASHVVQHAVDLVVASHPDQAEAPAAVRQYVRFGASPRGAQALVLAAKATALLDGRPNASTLDVRSMAAAALRHRLVLGYEAAADGVAADEVVDEILKAVPDPPTGLRGAP
jgi:MoxR-like ATPase